ncbi:MAG: O-antigen ligase family protein [Bacteroidales bacterium]|nr:O-antigen ligase family protein [Bacteroidales bacterium]
MSKIDQAISTIRDVLLYILLFLTAISYHPTIMRMSRYAGYESGTILSRYIVLLFLVVFVLSFSVYTIKSCKLVRIYLIWFVIIAIVAVIVQALFKNRSMVSELRTFLMVFGSIMIGYNLKADNKKIATILLVFSVTTLFSGLMQVLVNNGGFRIANQYITDSKNSLGAMLATACFSFFYLSRFWKKSLFKTIAIALAFLTLVVIVTIRARMAFVALALIVMYYYYLIKRNRNILISVIIVSLVVFFGALLIPNSIIDYLDASFTAGTQGEDFTSGRLVVYSQAIEILMQSPLLGNVQRFYQIGWVHNYPLLKLYSFGLLFSWPILALYLTILINVIKRTLHLPASGSVCFGYVCLLIPFIISMGEPTFPFGPGTVTLFNFILLGCSEKGRLSSVVSAV